MDSDNPKREHKVDVLDLFNILVTTPDERPKHEFACGLMCMQAVGGVQYTTYGLLGVMNLADYMYLSINQHQLSLEAIIKISNDPRHDPQAVSMLSEQTGITKILNAITDQT